jgi:hypothetical protein
MPYAICHKCGAPIESREQCRPVDPGNGPALCIPCERAAWARIDAAAALLPGQPPNVVTNVWD